jgi:hypothetical protein
MITQSLFATWNPTETLLERFQALHHSLEAKDNTRLEVKMSLVMNNQIRPVYGFNAQMFLDNWQKSPQLLEGVRLEKGVSLVLFSPYLIGDRVTSTMPMSRTKHLAVLVKGVISNISEIQADLSLYGCPHHVYMADDVILYLLEHYLETDMMSLIGAMQKLMKRLKGHFVLMVLITKGEWLMVGCRAEPLIISGDRSPIYFGTDFEAVEHFSQSSSSIVDKITVLFCMTPYQSELLTPITID